MHGPWRLAAACSFEACAYPLGPCTQVVYTLAPKYLYRDYFKAKAQTIWVRGPLGKCPTVKVSYSCAGREALQL